MQPLSTNDNTTVMYENPTQPFDTQDNPLNMLDIRRIVSEHIDKTPDNTYETMIDT